MRDSIREKPPNRNNRFSILQMEMLSIARGPPGRFFLWPQCHEISFAKSGFAVRRFHARAGKFASHTLVSIDGEAIEQARAAGADQIVLAAAAAWVRRIPRSIVGAVSIGMPELRRAGGFTRPIVAGVIHAIGVSASIRLRAGEHVMRIGRVAASIYDGALFSQRGQLDQIVAKARLLGRVSVQVGQTVGNFFTLGVVPGTIANAIACVDSGIVGAEIGMPGFAAAARRCGQRLADAVSSGKSAKIGAMPGTSTGDEETHGLRRRLRGLLRHYKVRACDRQCDSGQDGLNLFHSCLLRIRLRFNFDGTCGAQRHRIYSAR